MRRWPLAPLLILMGRRAALAGGRLARAAAAAEAAEARSRAWAEASRAEQDPAGGAGRRSAGGLAPVHALAAAAARGQALRQGRAAAQAERAAAGATLDAARAAWIAARAERAALEPALRRWQEALRRGREAAEEQELEDGARLRWPRCSRSDAARSSGAGGPPAPRCRTACG